MRSCVAHAHMPAVPTRVFRFASSRELPVPVAMDHVCCAEMNGLRRGMAVVWFA
jgi:hypothetical protein